MPAVEIRPGVWKGLVDAAEKRRRRPEALANDALQEFVERLADEELISRSAASARRSGLRMQNSEQAIRRYRRRG
jgi:hypothetical protein